ncbi:biotin--[acetyl-CoA-carboxylase] ligase [Thermogladius sp. 4427co]|uniref:biotin--[acetyl-CoA-carboxylase] ligase n=1 Tax=Thermogladius sp. 4427co TaxID=3450718 RepID=UPI003F7AF72B
MSDEPGILELALLDLLSNKKSISIGEASGELGLEKSEVLDYVMKLSKSFLIRVEDERIAWHSGDNPRLFKPWGWMTIYKVVTGSTMITARTLNPWSIVVSEYQISGRGRFGKTWISSLGGIWATYKIRSTPSTALMAPLLIPLFVSDALEKAAGLVFNIKWPNDVTYKTKKIAGILLEAESIGEDITLYIGIGINVNNKPPLPAATSLREVTGSLTPRNRILSYLTSQISRIEHYARRPEEVARRYLSKLETLGKRVIVETDEGFIEGTAEDVDEQGRLILKTDSGMKTLDPYIARNIRYLD